MRCADITSGGWRAHAARSSSSAASTPRCSPTKRASTAPLTRSSRGDGDIVWPQRARRLRSAERPQPLYDGGRVEGDAFLPARWDLLPADRYMWGSVQTVRGCPKHCSFCSVWRTDGQKPRQRDVDAVVREIVALRRQGFRFIAARRRQLLSSDAGGPRRGRPPRRQAAARAR